MKTVKSENIKELNRTFKIFANEQRLAIMNLLKTKGEKSVGQIADHLEIPFKTISKHLLYLSDKGILTRRHNGFFVLYEISGNLSKSVRLIISQII
jgi:DNA-binding transcriptional ArsR family regulator